MTTIYVACYHADRKREVSFGSDRDSWAGQLIRTSFVPGSRLVRAKGPTSARMVLILDEHMGVATSHNTIALRKGRCTGRSLRESNVEPHGCKGNRCDTRSHYLRLQKGTT